MCVYFMYIVVGRALVGHSLTKKKKKTRRTSLGHFVRIPIHKMYLRIYVYTSHSYNNKRVFVCECARARPRVCVRI